jgi:hypothetical protein
MSAIIYVLILLWLTFTWCSYVSRKVDHGINEQTSLWFLFLTVMLLLMWLTLLYTVLKEAL